MQDEMNLQKEIKSHIIVFMDRSVKHITKREAEKIDRVSSTPGAKATGIDLLDGGHYKFSMMAKVITIDAYYEQYPDQRPSENTPEFDIKRIIKDLKPTRRAKVLRSLVGGLKGFIISKGGEENILPETRKLLTRMEYRLNKATYEKQ